MNHEEFENRCLLSLYGELDPGEQAELERHLSGCSSCRSAMEGLKKMHKFLDENQKEPPEQLLWQSRQQLFARLRYETSQKERGFWNSLKESFQMMMRPIPVATLASAILIGLFFGYLSSNASVPGDPGNRIGSILDDPIRISEVRFKETGTESGEVELTFNASRRISLKGQLEDPSIQRVLAHALIREQNAGVRLQAISVIGAQDGVSGQGQIRAALIAAVKTDKNPAVRQQAFDVLKSYSEQAEVVTAILHVLRHDSNVKLRMEAIDALQHVLGTQREFEDEIKKVLEEKMRNDNNDYIRNQAKTVLQNAGYQYF